MGQSGMEEVEQSGTEEVGHDAYVRMVVEVEHSYWEVEEAGVHDHAGVEEVGLVHYGDHHDQEEVEVTSVLQLQVVDWPSQFHHTPQQSHR